MVHKKRLREAPRNCDAFNVDAALNMLQCLIASFFLFPLPTSEDDSTGSRGARPTVHLVPKDLGDPVCLVRGRGRHRREEQVVSRGGP